MTAELLSGLRGFARAYIRGIRHHREVRTEHLAEAVRGHFGLPPFPSLTDLDRLCGLLGIPIHRLPRGAPIEGANTWTGNGGPEIYVREDLRVHRLETTISHEVREVIETAFKLENSHYVGLDISNNRAMHQESEHFGGCLLMQAAASRDLLREVGFDLLWFSRETGRSLPSVVVRLQSLFSVASGHTAPHGGVWLFEAPWPLARSRAMTPQDYVARYTAQMCGFSMRKGGSGEAAIARNSFPARGSALPGFRPGLAAFERRRPVVERISGLDLFGDLDFSVGIEPILSQGEVSRVLAIAVRKDSLEYVAGWLARLDSGSEAALPVPSIRAAI